MKRNEDFPGTEILTELIRRKCGFDPTAVMGKVIKERGITDESLIRSVQVIFGRRAIQDKIRYLEAKAAANKTLDDVIEMRRKRLQEEA